MIKKIIAAIMSICMIFSLSACGDKEDSKNDTSSFEAKGDFLSGNYWEGLDDTLIELGTDGNFKYYQSANNKSDNYYSGTYEVKSAQNAIDYLVKEWGIGEETQRNVMTEYKVEDKDYYVLILYNEQRIMNGVNNLQEKNKTEYFGYYVESDQHVSFTRLSDLYETSFYKK